MSVQVVRVSADSSTEELMAAIKILRLKQTRMPAHWADRRAEVADEIDDLVARIVNT